MMRILIGALLLVSGAARADVEPGNWEISSTTTVQGAPAPVSVTQSRCLSEADARDPGRLFGAQPGSPCEFSNRKDDGSLMTFDIRCSGPPAMAGNARVRYAKSDVDAEINLRAEGLPQPIVMNSRVTGRRTGACQ